MAEPTTARVLSSQRPRFSVEDEPVPQLDSDLLELEVRHDEEGLSTLEGRFNNFGSDAEGGAYRWFDGEVLQLGRALKVAAGDEDNEALLFSGAITAITARFSEGHAPEILIRADDAAVLLRLGQSTRTWEGVSDAELAEQIAERRGLRSDATVEGPTHGQLWQVNQSDLGLLRTRARAVDARLEIGDTTLAFVPRRPDDAPDAIPLTTQRELLRFEATADLARQRTEVRVHGWSVSEKDGIHEAADGSVVTAESGGGTTGPRVLEDLGWDAVEHHHLEAPFTASEARSLATSMMRRRARRFLTAHGVTSGTPKLRVGGRIDVADAGPLFSGFWTVASVRHRFEPRAGLRTYFVAERTDLGGRG